MLSGQLTHVHHVARQQVDGCDVCVGAVLDRTQLWACLSLSTVCDEYRQRKRARAFAVQELLTSAQSVYITFCRNELLLFII